jgi:hypothetical protein
LVSSIIHKCITCRKLRGKTELQIMTDLPTDRVEPSPPFTNVGVDAFGPWTIVSRRTRGGYANSKRWAIFPGSTHVGGMWRVEFPHRSRVVQVILEGSIFDVDSVNLQIVYSAYKVCTSIRAEYLHFG